MEFHYVVQQDPIDPDVIHIFDTHFSDNWSDWDYAGYGEVPGDLTYAEYRELFDVEGCPPPENIVWASEHESDGEGGEGEEDEGEEGEDEEGGSGEGGEGEEGEGEEGEGEEGEGEEGEGEEGEGEGEDEEGEGGEGEGQQPADAGEQFEDSHAQLCAGLMEDYQETVEDLTEAIESSQTGPGDDNAAEAQGLGEEISSRAGELGELNGEALEAGEAAGRSSLLIDEATASLEVADGLGGGMSDVPTPSTIQFNEPPDLPQQGGDPVALSSGSFYHETVDVLIAAVGLDIDVTRIYSNQIYHSGSFGPKWDVWFDAHIRELTSGNAYLWSGAAYGELHGASADDNYEGPIGCRRQLTRSASGWDLHDRQGFSWRFAADGRISEKRDRFGNRVQVLRDATGRPTALRDGNGRQLDIVTDAAGRVQTIEDWTGRVWTYSYAGDQLAAVRHPATDDHPLGRTLSYAYVDGIDPRMRANLETITSPLGEQLVHNTYGQAGSGFNRVVAQSYTGDEHEFEYEVVTDELEPLVSNRHVASHRTVHSDARSVAHIHEFNVFGGLLSSRTASIGMHPDNPSGWTTGFRYDNQLHNEEIQLTGGSRLRFRYNTGSVDPLARHDLVEVRQNPSGGTTPAVHTYQYGPFGELSSVRNPLGAIIDYTLDALGRATTVTGPECQLADGSNQVIEVTADYNERGQLTRVTTGEGVVYEFDYFDAGDRRGLPRETRRDGTLIEAFEFDELWRLVTFSDEAGNEFQLEWDAADQVVRERAPQATGAERRYRYDAAGGLVLAGERIVAADGSVAVPEFVDVSFQRDDRGRLLQATQPLDAGQNAVTSFEWDEDDRLIGLTDAEGQETRWEWDERSLPVRLRRAVGTAREAQERFRHDSDGLLVEHIDANGNTTTMGYDPLLRPAELVDPLGTATRWSFDRCGNLTRVDLVDGDGALRERTRYEPDQLGRVRSVQQRVIDINGSAIGTLTNGLIYDRHGRPTSLLDHAARRYELSWDAADQLTSVVDPVGNTTLFGYDARGWITEMVAAGTSDAGDTTVIAHGFVYDELGRLVEAGDALGNTDRMQRDSRGLVTGYERAGGTVEKLMYDRAGRLTARIRDRVTSTGIALGTSTETFRYDRTGRPIEAIDARSNTASIQYDPAGDVALVELPGLTRVELEYDAAGNPVRVTDGRGTRFEISYDALHRETARQVVAAAGAEGPTLESFGYDATGNLVLAENANHAVTRAFDSLGRLRRETVDGRSLTRTYNPDGSPRDLVYPSGFRVRAAWDDAYRLRNLQVIETGSEFPGPAGTSGTLLSWDYAVELLPATLTTLPGAVHRFGYDAAGRDLEVALLDAAGGEDRLVNLRDGFGRPQHRIRNGLASIASRHDSLGWLDRVQAGPAVPLPDLDPWRPRESIADPQPDGDQAQLDALIDSLAPSPANTTRSDSYGYDASGNRVSQAHSAAGQTDNQTWSYDAANRVVEVGGAVVQSDDAGNTTDDGAHRYRYDYLGRLVRIQDAATGDDLAVLSRDALGRVLSVKAGGQQRQRLYSVDDLIEERTGGGAVTRLFVPGSRIDQPLVLFQDGNALYAHQDPVGTILALSDASGQIVERYLRDEFGGLLGSFDAAGNPLATPDFDPMFGFQGRDAWTDVPPVVDFRSRVYRADWGRFLQPDPLGLVGGLNLYVFVANDPLFYVDPYGELFFLAIAAGALIGAGVSAWFNRDKKGKDFAVAVLAGGLGGALAGSGLGLAGFIAGGAASGGIMGGYEGYKVGGVQGAVVGGTFGGVFGGLAGGLGGYAGQRIATPVTGWVTNALAGRLSGQVAYGVGAYAGAGLGAGVGGGLAGGTNGFGQGFGTSLAAGLDPDTALRNGWDATLPGVGYGALTGVGAGMGAKGLMQTGSYLSTKNYAGVIGNEGEFFVSQSIGQRLNRTWSTPQGKVPDFWGNIRGEVKNTAKVPSLGARKGQLRSFLNAARADGEVLHLFTRPGVQPPPGGQISGQVAAGNIVIRTIPHWAYPALTTETIGS